MRHHLLVAAAVIAMPMAALTAQTTPAAAPVDAPHAADPYQPEKDGSAAASASVPPGEIALGADPGTATANATVAGDLAAVKAVNANNRAQYAADLASYDSAMHSHDQRSVRYAQQKRAYADAMAVWRAQVDACNRGKTAACKAPAPDPAAFY